MIAVQNLKFQKFQKFQNFLNFHQISKFSSEFKVSKIWVKYVTFANLGETCVPKNIDKNEQPGENTAEILFLEKTAEISFFCPAETRAPVWKLDDGYEGVRQNPIKKLSHRAHKTSVTNSQTDAHVIPQCHNETLESTSSQFQIRSCSPHIRRGAFAFRWGGRGTLHF